MKSIFIIIILKNNVINYIVINQSFREHYFFSFQKKIFHRPSCPVIKMCLDNVDINYDIKHEVSFSSPDSARVSGGVW